MVPRADPAPQGSLPMLPRWPMAQLLVVDDEPWIAELLVAALTAEGHVVDTAPHGAAALEKIRETSYDLIVSDILERPSKVQGVEGEPFPTDQPFPDRPCDIAADEPIVRPGSRQGRKIPATHRGVCPGAATRRAIKWRIHACDLGLRPHGERGQGSIRPPSFAPLQAQRVQRVEEIRRAPELSCPSRNPLPPHRQTKGGDVQTHGRTVQTMPCEHVGLVHQRPVEVHKVALRLCLNLREGRGPDDRAEQLDPVICLQAQPTKQLEIDVQNQSFPTLEEPPLLSESTPADHKPFDVTREAEASVLALPQRSGLRLPGRPEPPGERHHDDQHHPSRIRSPHPPGRRAA